jgi:hypothetical protein
VTCVEKVNIIGCTLKTRWLNCRELLLVGKSSMGKGSVLLRVSRLICNVTPIPSTSLSMPAVLFDLLHSMSDVPSMSIHPVPDHAIHSESPIVRTRTRRNYSRLHRRNGIITIFKPFLFPRKWHLSKSVVVDKHSWIVLGYRIRTTF